MKLVDPVARVAWTPPASFAERVRAECTALAEMLIAKNQAYGNSALEPVRVFSQASPVEQILVRIDDKLSRLARGASASEGADKEDVVLDLIGYLILLRLARGAATGPVAGGQQKGTQE